MKIIKRLAKCIREYKAASIKTPIYVSLEVLFEILMPLVLVKFVAQIRAESVKDTLIYGGVLILMAFASLIFGALSGKECATASAGFAKNLREDLFNNVQEFSFSNIDKFSTSSLVTRLTTDISNVQQAYMMIIRIAVRCPLMLVSALIASFFIDSQLPLIFCVLIPVLGVSMYFIIRTVMPLFNRVFKKYDALNSSVQENVRGMRVVKAYVREDYENKKFKLAAEDICNDFTKAEKIIAFSNPLVNLCAFSAMILIAFFGAKIIIAQGGTGLQIESISSLLIYSMQILMSLMMLTMISVMVFMSAASAKRIYEVLNEKSTLTNPENPVYEIKNGDVEFENVSFKYNAKAERNALNNINVKFESGKTYGIIGGTGSSKTSLVNLISRLYDVTEGSVKVGGVDVRNYDIESLRNAVSVVLQKNVLFSGTIKENLRWGDKNATDEEIEKACKLAQADEFIQSFSDKYDTHIEQGGSNVSGGQKQRLCIARAILKKPLVLILDDSTSAVDTKTDALIRRALKNEIPETTKIIIAQRVASVQDADEIIVLENGEISGIGTHAELLENNNIYKEVFDTQNRISNSNGGIN